MVITSETNDLYLDAPEFEPFWAECEKLGMFVFVHPALKLNQTMQFDGYDTARSVGREFSLVMAMIRLINSGVFDRHPKLMIHMSHLGGGLSALLGRIRSYQDKDFWGTADNARHGAKAKQEFDHYIRNNFVFDTAGFCGALGAVKTALIEIPASRIVFATDYPQEIRDRSAVADFVKELRALGKDGEAILSGNVGKLSRSPPRRREQLALASPRSSPRKRGPSNHSRRVAGERTGFPLRGNDKSGAWIEPSAPAPTRRGASRYRAPDGWSGPCRSRQ